MNKTFYIGLIDGEPDYTTETAPELYDSFKTLKLFESEEVAKTFYTDVKEVRLTNADEVLVFKGNNFRKYA